MITRIFSAAESPSIQLQRPPKLLQHREVVGAYPSYCQIVAGPHNHTFSLSCQGTIQNDQSPCKACFWIVGGNRSDQRKAGHAMLITALIFFLNPNMQRILQKLMEKTTRIPISEEIQSLLVPAKELILGF